MEHIEIRFGDNIETPASEDKSFEQMFQSVNPMFCFSKRVWKPQMDIFETRNKIIIQAEIAPSRIPRLHTGWQKFSSVSLSGCCICPASLMLKRCPPHFPTDSWN